MDITEDIIKLVKEAQVASANASTTLEYATALRERMVPMLELCNQAIEDDDIIPEFAPIPE